MLQFNREKLRDKIYACWIGKNIGGTIGTPFEGKREVLNVQGYTSPKGEPLPNDDLDLQLVWLKSVERYGSAVTEQLLAEMWVDWIVPHWSEYGISKSNMRFGMLPPLSGMYNNPWKDSNGAWIRSEIWACLNPGCVNNVLKYAYMDACVDHGISEGTWAELFTAALQSAAFIEHDLHKLIDIALSKIPDDCRVAKSVKIAVDCYNNGEDWLTARNKIVDDSADLGWFMAPANVAFTVIGLLYGEGDFKKTIITAVNCGDDTDCTGATAGAVMGIIGGTAGIPEDWRDYIGDSIVSISLLQCHAPHFPKSCTELTDRVMNQLGRICGSFVKLTDSEDCFEGWDPKAGGNSYASSLKAISPYSYMMEFGRRFNIRVEFDRQPDIKPFESINVKLTVYNNSFDQKHYEVRWILPEGWTVTGKKHITTHWLQDRIGPDGKARDMQNNSEKAVGEYTVTAGENVESVNRLIAEVVCHDRPTAGYAPVVIMG